MSEETKEKIEALETEFNNKLANNFMLLMAEINKLKEEIRKLKKSIED